MCAHWCVKSYLIKARKRLQQWTVPVHLIKSTCSRQRWEMESKANTGAAAAAARSFSFSLDANQRLDLRAGQASRTLLCLADPGNLLLIIPPPPTLSLSHSAPLRTQQPISPNLYSHGNTQTQPPKYMPGSPGNNHIMAMELLHAAYDPISFCASNLGIP